MCPTMGQKIEDVPSWDGKLRRPEKYLKIIAKYVDLTYNKINFS